MFCTRCGAFVDDKTKICPSCGVSLKKSKSMPSVGSVASGSKGEGKAPRRSREVSEDSKSTARSVFSKILAALASLALLATAIAFLVVFAFNAGDAVGSFSGYELPAATAGGIACAACCAVPVLFCVAGIAALFRFIAHERSCTESAFGMAGKKAIVLLVICIVILICRACLASISGTQMVQALEFSFSVYGQVAIAGIILSLVCLFLTYVEHILRR